MKNLLKTALVIACLCATSVMAETWATGDCTTASGGKIRYVVHDGSGFISYGSEGPYEMFSKRDGNIGIITHIGSAGNMVLAVDLNTGRGYVITRFDDGRTNEKNVACKLGSTQR